MVFLLIPLEDLLGHDGEGVEVDDLPHFCEASLAHVVRLFVRDVAEEHLLQVLHSAVPPLLVHLLLNLLVVLKQLALHDAELLLVGVDGLLSLQSLLSNDLTLLPLQQLLLLVEVLKHPLELGESKHDLSHCHVLSIHGRSGTSCDVEATQVLVVGVFSLSQHPHDSPPIVLGREAL